MGWQDWHSRNFGFSQGFPGKPSGKRNPAPLPRPGTPRHCCARRIGRRKTMVRRSLCLMAGAFLLLSLAGAARASGSNGGSGSDMPAFYDGQLFTINFMQVKPKNNNKSINTIYMCGQCEQQNFMFISVLDAIQGDGFNPLW